MNRNKIFVFEICAIILASFSITAFLTFNFINSERSLRTLSKIDFELESNSFLDINSPEIRKRINDQIKFYESIERNPVQHMGINEEESMRKGLRKLEDVNTFDEVGLADASQTANYYISHWITENLKQYSSDLLVYPYSFDYIYQDINNTEQTKHYTHGAFITLSPSSLDPYTFGLKTNHTISVERSRAIYAHNIAILSIEHKITDQKEDLFYDTVDWCTFWQSSLGKGICYSTHDEFLAAKKANSSKTYVAKLNHTDIISGNLLDENGLPKFGILIIPDFKLGVQPYIKSLLTQKGIDNLVNYFNKGGIIIAEGKSGYLLEEYGLVTKGTYDTSKLFSSDSSNRKIKVKGCEGVRNKKFSPENDDITNQLLCMGYDDSRQPCLSSTFKIKKDVTTNLKVLLSVNPKFGDLVYTDTKTGLSKDLTEEEQNYTPMVLERSNSNGGHIFVLNYNPVYAGAEKTILLNLLILASSKEMYINSKVNMKVNSPEKKDMPIPAGESGVELEINTLFHNLGEKMINEFSMYVFLPHDFEWIGDVPDSCVKKPISSKGEIPKNILIKKVFDSENDYLYCKLSSLSGYQKKYFKSKIGITNYKATQEKYEILIQQPIVSYTDSKGHENILAENVKVCAEAASVLRVAINPDPSAFYPYLGRGQYIDNGVKVENKEESEAFDVQYVGLIPLVSPLTDISDQRMLQHALQIYVDYYNGNNFEVPLTSENAQDYVYPGLLMNKAVKMVMEWDSPVLPVKEIDPSKGLSGQEIDIDGINMGMLTITSSSEVIKQINYRKSDRFYKLASQRLMAFVDVSKPEGAIARWGSKGNIPEEWLDPVFKDRGKKEFIFSRSDIFFYENENYCNPPGVKDNHVFTVDKYKEYRQNEDGCVSTRGEARSKVVKKGYFSNFNDEKKKNILLPEEWSNELLEYCNQIVIDASTDDEIIKEFGSNENLKSVHYIIPNVDENITQPGQIYGFKQTDSHHGYLEKYPSVKFTYVHSLTFIISAKQCLYGGMIQINLKDYKVNSMEDITLSPDQIAFYNTEYDSENHLIKAFFKRGLMSNEQYGKDISVTINIENLSSNQNIDLEVTVFDCKYDISYPPQYERLYPYETKLMTFTFSSAFSYPALELRTKLNRAMGGYETLEPFSRYGTYIQELIGHRPIYSIVESHHQTSPGLTGAGSGFSTISNLGISSIPFLEYVTAGAGQVIPAGPSTSRVSWTDTWGRKWHQPLRSLFPDVPPLPPPLKNFMMTTSFEILREGKRVMEWCSDENVQIHLHVKLLNNYPKYFEITRCKENQIRFVPKKIGEQHLREFSNTCDENLSDSECNGDKMFMFKGGFANYGICYQDDATIVGGHAMDEDFKKKLAKARLCADSTDADEIAKCNEALKDIVTLNRKPENYDETKIWNYSPLVEKHYPKGYIEKEMWDMSIIDYDDSNMEKAYKYHFDDLVPNLDNTVTKPQDTVAIPVYKGLGFDITYDKDNSMIYHGVNKTGWWSDDLQNKDDTLMAGQELSNKISVDKKSQITEWIDYKELKGAKRENSDQEIKDIIDKRMKNIYVCLYNRRRPKVPADGNGNYFGANVVENNVVPIIVSLDKNDKRLSQYNCVEENQYTPDSIHELTENYLPTLTGKDYLYYAANLRSGAKESFNVLLNLNYFPKIKYEGMTKISEGGRFVYWNPPNGPNSYLIVDSPVSVINAKRNDIEVKNEIFPLRTTTFNAVVYHLYTFYDENKINKVWPFENYYTNDYGFGDVAVSVYVGKIRNSKAILYPGQTTYVKIVFLNNCGFDWNMYANAIDFEYIDSKPLNAQDLLFRLKHTIQKPLKYNFLTTSVEEVYQKYITIEPSDHNIDVAPEFFDFDNINIVTVRDGFKGEYYLKVKVSSEFPENLRGKPIEIKIDINGTYFDHFPGADNDPIKNYHDYIVKVPSAFIGVPFKDGEFKDKVLYTSAQAKNLDMKFNLGIDWNIDGIKYIDDETIDNIKQQSSEQDFNKYLLQTWNSINSENVEYTEKISGETKIVTIDGVNDKYNLFPKLNYGSPDTAKVNFFVKSTVSQLKYGYSYPINSVRTFYQDWIGKYKVTYGISPQLYAEGAWLELSYSRTLVDEVSPGVYVDSLSQQLGLTDEGIMKVQFKLENVGNGISYNTNYQIIIQPNLTYIGDESGKHKITQEKNKEGQTILNFNYGTPINAGELKGGIIYLRYKKYIDSYDGLSEEEINDLPSQLKVVQESSARIDLTNTTGEIQVTQHLRKSLVFDYTKKNSTGIYVDLIVSGKRKNPTATVVPKIKYLDGENEDDVLVSISKIDLTQYPQNDTTNNALRILENEIDEEKKYDIQYLYQNKTPIEKEDKPHKREPEMEKHIVMYGVSLYNKKSKVTSSTFIIYEQEKIGLSIYEYIFIILSIILYSGAFILIFLGYRNWKLSKGSNLEKQISEIETQMNKLIDED